MSKCNRCGTTLHGLLTGSLCPECKSIERERDEDRKSEEEREEQVASALAELLSESNRSREQSREDLAAAAVYIANATNNPGDYYCPSCKLRTLVRDASRCPKCHVDIDRQYWSDIEEREREARRRAKEAADKASAEKAAKQAETTSSNRLNGALFSIAIFFAFTLPLIERSCSDATVKEIPSWHNTTTDTRLRFKGPAFGGMVAAGQRVALTLHVADAPNCTPTSSGTVECQVVLYSGGRPNPGISMDVFRREFALVIDEVDMTMELQTIGGDVITRSRTFAAGATPGYQQVIVAPRLSPGEYRVVASSRKSGHFSVLWTESLGD